MTYEYDVSGDRSKGIIRVARYKKSDVGRHLSLTMVIPTDELEELLPRLTEALSWVMDKRCSTVKEF